MGERINKTVQFNFSVIANLEFTVKCKHDITLPFRVNKNFFISQIDEQIETLFASKKRVTDVAKSNMPQVAAGECAVSCCHKCIHVVSLDKAYYVIYSLAKPKMVCLFRLPC